MARHCSVLIAGGGPVGLTMAHDLGRRGIDCLLVERNAQTTRHPKMDHTNPRSMELFSLAGLEPQLRAVAVPEQNSFDISWVTTMTGYELRHYPYPSPRQSRDLFRQKNDGSSPYSPSMRVSQTEIEPVLKRAAELQGSVEVRFATELIDLEQYEDHVIATVRDCVTGATEQIHSLYLAACDGGNSTARQAVGIAQSGQRKIMPRFMTHFRVTDQDSRALLQRWGQRWHYQSNHGTLVSQNDHDTWTLHSRYPENEADGKSPHMLVERFLGRSIQMEVLVANPWSPHLLVADRAGHNRVWLAGDAAHQYIPTGGYGMNTGIADAYGLSWVLAALVKGFGGPGLLAAYEAERRPVWHRNRMASEKYNKVRVAIAALYSEDLNNDGADGQAARHHASNGIESLGNDECESLGIELGYHYAGSPAVAAEIGAIPPSDLVKYVPNTLPGARLPNVFLPDGRALFECLGSWFTLLVFGEASHAGFREASDLQRIPLHIVRIDSRTARSILGVDMILVRPDQHVAWRGTKADISSASKILGMACGWF